MESDKGHLLVGHALQDLTSFPSFLSKHNAIGMKNFVVDVLSWSSQDIREVDKGRIRREELPLYQMGEVLRLAIP